MANQLSKKSPIKLVSICC